MKVTQIEYSSLRSVGHYENEKIGVVVALEEGETPHEAVKRAKAFVGKIFEQKKPTDYEINQAQRTVENPDDYSPRAIREAKKVLEYDNQDLPF